ncbi:MAG: hypothetical protein DMD90_17935 [Candidatus Rokuibacteriota bacterium]|nr:MAG: hypothetical protein DMD90_17935 [Candidatus Rokubacteria bacterium]
MAARGSVFSSLLFGLVVYGGGAYAVVKYDLWQLAGTPLTLTPMHALVAPLGFYLFLALTALVRRVGLRALGIFVGRCALHVMLVIATAAVLVQVMGIAAERAVGLSVIDLPPLVGLQMFAVATSLAPLAVSRPRSRKEKSKRSQERPHRAEERAPEAMRSPAHATVHAPAPRPVPAPAPVLLSAPVASAPPPLVAPASPPHSVKAEIVPPRPPAPAVTPPAVIPPSVVTPPPHVTPPAPQPVQRQEGPRREEATVTPAQASRPPHSEPAEEMVRISFERIAGQLPADAFRLPLDRLGANLLEPGHLLVPRRLLGPQLAEGRARVQWSVVAEQFPRQAVTVSDADIAARLPEGALTLPLDEVIRQLPGDAFALSSPIVDVRGIEDFPPPFQPHVPPPSEERPAAPVAEVARSLTIERFDVTRAPEPELEEPAVSVEPAVEREPVLERAPVIERTPLVERAPSFEHAPVVEREAALEREPAAEPEPEPEPEPVMSDPIGAAEREVVVENEVEGEPEPERVRFAAATEREVVPVAEQELEPPRVSAPFIERRRRAEPSRVAALLKPILSALEVQEQRVGRLTVLSVASPELAADAVVESAAILAPLLDDRRLPAPASQATVRGAQGAIVLTPLGVLAESAPLLAVAVAPGAPLAYLERVALRAVEAGALNGRRSSSMNGYGDGGDDLRDTTVPSHVRTLGESFRAFGKVVPTVLQDRSSSLICYMFLAPGLAARPLAHYARALREAMRGSALGPLESFILRMGEDRLVVREVDAGRGAAALLVAGGGPVDRLGLARLELERAVTRLGAR